MNDYWNDPPDDLEPPECCGEYMDVCEDTGIATCATCQQRIEPEPDIEPILEELPDDSGSSLFAVGDRVEFLGYCAPSFEYANLRRGDQGIILNVKRPGQIGMDYGVKFDSGKRAMLNHNEVRRVEASFADMDLRAWHLMINNPSSTCGAIVEMMTAEFGTERVAAHAQHCRERAARLNPL